MITEKNPTFEEIGHGLKNQVLDHLSKFIKLDELIDRWLDYYYRKYLKEHKGKLNKEEYRDYLKGQIQIYLSVFDKGYRKPGTYDEEKKYILNIQIKYNEMLFEGEYNPYLQENIGDIVNLGPKGNKARNGFSGLIASILTKEKEE